MIVIPVPTLSLINVNTGDPPKVTSSPATTPDKKAVPVAVALVVPSYTLSSPFRPLIVSDIKGSVVTSTFVGVICKLGVPSSSSATT